MTPTVALAQRARLTRALSAGLIALLAGAATLQAAPADLVTVREEAGLYLVTAEFEVNAGTAAVLRVLSTYERIPEFAPGVKKSVVKERQGSRAVVEQEAVSRVLMFSKRVHLLLDIQEDSNTIAFRDICGRSFVSYEGSWRVVSAPRGATVVYTLAAKPAFDVPQFVLTRVLKKDAAALIVNLQREIERQ